MIVLQTLADMIDCGMAPHKAVDARLCITDDRGMGVYLEPRALSAVTRAVLAGWARVGGADARAKAIGA